MRKDIKVPYKIPIAPGIWGSEITVNGHKGSVVVGENEDGWEHVSFSPYFKNYIPHWKDMCDIKNMFWGEDEECIQFFPKASEYVNIMENCLHIWKWKAGKLEDCLKGENNETKSIWNE